MQEDKISVKQGLLVLVIVIIGVGFMFGNNYLKEKNQLARDKFTQEKTENERKFDADQKETCLAIYKQESIKWNNTNGWKYDDTDDTCFIQYKSSPKPTQADCDAQYKGEDGKVLSFFLREWVLCQDGLFEKSF